MKKIILTAVIFFVLIGAYLGYVSYQNKSKVLYPAEVFQDTIEVVENHINFHNIDMTDKQQIMHYIDSCRYKLSKKTSLDDDIVWYDYKKKSSIGIGYKDDEIIIMEVFNNAHNYNTIVDSIDNAYPNNYMHENLRTSFININVSNEDGDYRSDVIYIEEGAGDISIMYKYNK